MKKPIGTPPREASEQRLAEEQAKRMPPSLSPSDPNTIIAGIRQFSLAPDGSDLRDLEAAFARLQAALREASEALRDRVSDKPVSAALKIIDAALSGKGES